MKPKHAPAKNIHLKQKNSLSRCTNMRRGAMIFYNTMYSDQCFKDINRNQKKKNDLKSDQSSFHNGRDHVQYLLHNKKIDHSENIDCKYDLKGKFHCDKELTMLQDCIYVKYAKCKRFILCF